MNENAHEAYLDSATGAVVVSEIDPEDVELSLYDTESAINKFLPIQARRALASWAENSRGTKRRDRSLFQRDRYVTPGKVFDQMALAYDALDDDIVGNVADMSESLAFQKIQFESEDKDQEDVWNQIGRDLDLDSFVRVAWRELFTVSQFYAVRWWATKSYKVRGKGDGGRARRASWDLKVPIALGFLDPTRIVPVKADLWGNAQLAWIADEDELSLWEDVRKGTQNDQMVGELFVGKYEPTEHEKQSFSKEDVPTDRLMILNPNLVFRHALTKSPFERWARLRLKSIFPLLDLKHQLREMDRAWLLGGINFLVLVTRGSDDIPTTTDEVNETAAQVRTQSKSPIIVSDHRIKIEIITPDVQHVLNQDKWAVLDERIMMRLWGTFSQPSKTSSQETSLTLGRVIARGLASRRHMLKRTIEKYLIKAVQDINDEFEESAKIEFQPRRIDLEMDAALITNMMEMRDRGDLSRETLLAEFNFDQDLEAMRREYEDDRWEDVFTPVNVPFDSPEKTTPGGSGRQGGRPAGKPAAKPVTKQAASEET